uniref:Uncharacterized protein n=1 Tax=Megaselia scalaris TaxID=36166 RepID=T1GGD6_MEGSC
NNSTSTANNYVTTASNSTSTSTTNTVNVPVNSPHSNILVTNSSSTYSQPPIITSQTEAMGQTTITEERAFYSAQKTNNKLLWKDPEILPEIVSNEIVVAGVYLRLFVSNPAWTLRKPKQFLSDLLDFVVDNISKTSTEKEVMELSTTALVELLRSQPNLADDIPVLGHIPKLFRLLPVQPKNTLSVLHQLSISEFCVTSISQTECILPLKKCMESNSDLIEKTCETLSRLFKYQLVRFYYYIHIILEKNIFLGPIDKPIFRSQFDSIFVRFVRKSLGLGCEGTIVSALKAMTHNLNYGERVSQVLLKHPAWAEFKDQRHDLFIKDTSNVRGYLTGITPTAGYLTQGPSQNVEVVTVPPPIDRDDPLARPTD